MMNKIIFVIVLVGGIFAQLNQDARMLGLNGAYTTVARGYQCVGINPANLVSDSKLFTLNFFTLNMGFGNNSISLNFLNEINGANFEDADAELYFPKSDLEYIFDNNGLLFSTEFTFPLPILNFSYKNYALTSGPKIFSKFGIPNGFVDFMINGNEIGKDLSISMPVDIMSVHETALSYAYEAQQFSIGGSFKYILGGFYSTFESIDSSYFRTDSTAFTGSGSYLMKQAIGGNGFGLDIGVLSKRNQNGIQIGASLTNLFASIKWTQNHFLRSSIENSIKSSLPEQYYLRQNEFYYYQLKIDSMNAINLSSKSIDEIVSRVGYKVIKVDDLSGFNLIPSDSLVIELSNQEGYLIPSEDISNSTLDSLSSNPLKVNYPSIFRLGISKHYDEGVLVVADLSTGFSEDIGGYGSWRIAFGSEITHYPLVTLRTGIAFGGLYSSSLSMGLGFKINSLNLDLGMAYRDGLSINSMHGLDISVSLSYR